MTAPEWPDTLTLDAQHITEIVGWMQDEGTDSGQYIRHDLHIAAIAAAYGAEADKCREMCAECGGTGQRDTGSVYPWGEVIFAPCYCDHSIRALTPDDATAALEAVIAAAVKAERERCAAIARSFGDNHLCVKCGHPKSNHPFRHPFQGVIGDPASIAAAIMEDGE